MANHKLTRARLDNLQKTIFRLLEVGKEAYMIRDEQTKHLVDAMNALIIQRNSGLDGFLKTHHLGTPVAIRVQRPNETIAEAKKHLLRASATKDCILKILIRTTLHQHTAMFELEDADTNLLVVDSYDLIISQWLQEKQMQEKTLSV